MQDLRVGIIQTEIFWEDKVANYRHLEENYFSKIAIGSADIIILPEMFNTGFSMNVKQLAEKMNGPTVNWMVDQAKKLNCQIAGSCIVEDEGRFFNRFIVVSKNGIESQYDKRHLFRMANENDYFSPGIKRIIHELKGWKILLQVCYDLRFPVFSRNRMINGEKEYDVVIYTANWPEKRAFIWKNLIQARAIENQAYAVGINRVGKDGNSIQYSGDSCVIDPWGNQVELLTPSTASYKIVDLKSAELEKIKTSFPAYLDADNLENIF